MSTAETAAPAATTFLQQLTEHTDHEFYGVKVMWIGEDGDVLVLGHPGERRALAAANKLARVDAGLVNLYDSRHELIDWEQVRPKWAVPAHAAGCKYVRAFDEWCSRDDAGAGGEQPPAVALGDLIREGQDCGCERTGDGEWYIRYVAEGTPGAFPITEIGPTA